LIGWPSIQIWADTQVTDEAGLRSAIANPPGDKTITITTSFTVADQIVINSPLTIQGKDNTITIQVVAPGVSSYRLFSIGGTETGTITFKNLILEGGKFSPVFPSNINERDEIENDRNGGIIFVDNPNNTLLLESVTMKNATALNGGAVYSKGNVNVKDCTFENNTVDHGTYYVGLNVVGGGGAIRAWGNVNIEGKSTFTGNKATATGSWDEAFGGAVFTDGDLTIQGSESIPVTFSNNGLYLPGKNAVGGAVHARGKINILYAEFKENEANEATDAEISGDGRRGKGIVTGEQEIRIISSSFTNNTTNSPNGEGGAIYALYKDHDLYIEDCLFHENIASEGGAIYSERESNYIKDSKFTENTAWKGGAFRLASHEQELMDVKFINSEFAENKVRGSGAVAHIRNGSADKGVEIQLTDCIFTDNTAQESGGVLYFENAIEDIEEKILIQGEKTKFLNNIAYNNIDNSLGSGGGAISVFTYSKKLHFEISQELTPILFKNNRAEEDSGGAINIINREGSIDFNIHGEFTDNYSLYYGGAIALSAYSDKVVSTIQKGSLFKTNEVGEYYGGAIYIQAEEGSSLDIQDEKDSANPMFYKNKAFERGGAIFFYGEPDDLLTVKGVVFEGNESRIGGAISISGGTGLIDNCEFTENIGKHSDPSYSLNGGAITTYGELTLKDNTFKKNKAGTSSSTSSSGGAIYAGSGANLSFEGINSFTENEAINGGAIYAYYANITIPEGVTFTENKASANGGAIYHWYGTSHIANSIFKKNEAKNAGAIYNNGALTLVNVDIRENKATDYGGAIYNNDSNRESITKINFTNVLIADNTAGNTGGGMHNQRLSSDFYLTNLTITNNSATAGGGGFNNAPTSTVSPIIRNSIIWGNTASSNNNISYNLAGNGPLSFSNSLVEDYTQADQFDNIDGNSDPLFETDYTLNISSPALNSGNNLFFENTSTPNLSLILYDLAGNDRIFDKANGGTIDMGVYERTYAQIIYHSNFNTDQTVTHIYSKGATSVSILSYSTSALPNRDGYAFIRWNTMANGSGSSYEADQTINMDESIHLYAQWNEDEEPPVNPPIPPIPPVDPPVDPDPNPDPWISVGVSSPYCYTDQEIRIAIERYWLDTDFEYIIRFSEDAKKAGLTDITVYETLPKNVNYIAIAVSSRIAAGTYSGSIIIRESDDHSQSDSFPFKVEILQETQILEHPQSITQHQYGEKFTLAVEAAGNGLTYQWFLNGQSIEGATSKTYEGSLNTENSGIYHVEVYGECGWSESDPATVSSCFEVLMKWDDVLYVQNLDGKYIKYQWYKDGEAITTHGNSIYYTDTNGLLGTYHVRAYYDNEKYTESCSITFSEKTRSSVLSVYPNPILRSEQLTVESNEIGESYIGALIEVFDFGGRKIYSTQAISPKTTIPMNTPAGVYVVNITALNGKRTVQKIVVK